MRLDSFSWSMVYSFGIVILAIFNIFTFISYALLSTSYSPMNNFISTLGDYNFNPKGALIYNIGIMMMGIAYFPFFLTLRNWYIDDKSNKFLLIIVQILGCLLGFTIIMIGIFSENFFVIHMLLAGTYFTFIIGIFFLLGVALYNHPDFNKKISVFGFIIAIIDVFLIISTFPLLEWIVVYCTFVYFGLISNITYKHIKNHIKISKDDFIGKIV